MLKMNTNESINDIYYGFTLWKYVKSLLIINFYCIFNKCIFIGF